VRRSLEITAALVALPWTWFLVRDVHVVLDLVALGLPAIVVVVVLGCLIVAARRRRWGPLLVGASWLVVGLVAIVGPWLPHSGYPPVHGVRVVAVNTYGERSDSAAVEREVVSQGTPMVVVVSEPAPDLGRALTQRYGAPFGLLPGRAVGASDPLVFTDLPASDIGLPDSLAGQRALRIRVDGPAGPFVVYGLHLQRPRFGPSGDDQVSVRAHARAIDRLLVAIAKEELPVVLAGDLNLVDRASGYRKLSSLLDDAVRSDWVRPTALRPIGLPFLPRIDHVFVSSGWCSGDGDIFPLPGSDHRGVAATVGRCPG